MMLVCVASDAAGQGPEGQCKALAIFLFDFADLTAHFHRMSDLIDAP